MKPEKMKVAVLAGGVSGEREISQRSGAAVAKALRSMGVRLVEVDVKSRQVEVPAGTDICFLCLHGSYGEDGTLQAELDAMGMGYTGSGAMASALAFDKLRAKEVMAEALEQGGTSFDSLYVNVNGESGYFDRRLNAYGREGEPCPRCGTPIRRSSFMNRSSFWCPRCQPAPRARAKRPSRDG
jgi:hypothetical protein